MDSRAWWATVHGVAKVRYDLATKQHVNSISIKLEEKINCTIQNKGKLEFTQKEAFRPQHHTVVLTGGKHFQEAHKTTERGQGEASGQNARQNRPCLAEGVSTLPDFTH